MSQWPYTGAIFCGGESRRMGVPKTGLPAYHGVGLIEHVYRALSQVCRQVVLVGHHKGLPCSLQGVSRMEDLRPDLGPLGGLETLLSSIVDDEYLISPCYLIDVGPELYRLLTDEDKQSPVILRSPGGQSR